MDIHDYHTCCTAREKELEQVIRGLKLELAIFKPVAPKFKVGQVVIRLRGLSGEAPIIVKELRRGVGRWEYLSAHSDNWYYEEHLRELTAEEKG
jgi:hypothetical protein